MIYLIKKGIIMELEEKIKELENRIKKLESKQKLNILNEPFNTLNRPFSDINALEKCVKCGFCFKLTEGVSFYSNNFNCPTFMKATSVYDNKP